MFMENQSLKYWWNKINQHHVLGYHIVRLLLDGWETLSSSLAPWLWSSYMGQSFEAIVVPSGRPRHGTRPKKITILYRTIAIYGTCSYGHLSVITGYKWDCTLYKWGCGWVLITGISRDNCGFRSFAITLTATQCIQERKMS